MGRIKKLVIKKLQFSVWFIEGRSFMKGFQQLDRFADPNRSFKRVCQIFLTQDINK